MANEPDPAEAQNLWRDQPVDAAAISAVDLRRKAQRLEAQTRRSFRVLAVFMTLAAAGYASFLYFFPGTVHRIGSGLTLAGYLYCTYQVRRRRHAGGVQAEPAPATCLTYRAQLERQRDFSRTAWKTVMLPLVPGPAVFMLGFLVPELGPVKAAGLTTAIILSPFVPAIPLGRLKARAMQREIDELDAITTRS